MNRVHFAVLFLLGIAMLAAQSGCAHFAREQLYAPPVGPVITPDWSGPEPDRISVTTEDGLDLAGFYWAPMNGNPDIILVLHGRRDNAGRMAGYIQRLAEDGRGVLVASYRGFNDNRGSPSEDGLITDAQAFYRFAREAAGAQGDVYVFGHSLGGAVAIQLAARETLSGVMTLATFSDLGEAAPYFSEIFIPDSWESIVALNSVEEPLLFIHGSDDDYVEPGHSRRLFRTTCSLAALAIIDGVRHRPNFRLIAPLITGWVDALENGQVEEISIEGAASWESKPACDAA
ncbi:alpha/beta fold hydrolase [Parasphingopyxis algicola]|uniref:alpha/beta hydrolase n=1 Tax=Parasphingopyxis algicola TaxID=2026624 RepID=UPI0015A459C1|nr:alpha/beta fold hydrolase [Parasphingopyxis algicola]QLC26208.1 alpha/beta fold hydrolase [Parasphingopyxis algicola]